MKKVIRTFFSICFGLTLLQSCIDNSAKMESQSGEVVSAVAADDQNEADLKASLSAIEKEEQARLLGESSAMTSMSFDKTTQDFGKIKEDTENNASFIVTNTGTKPLIIEKVDVSCGCTTAKKPEKPIAPGKSDKIEIIFHPKVGQLNEQNKTVTITANTEPKTAVLNIKAFVTEK